MDVPASHWPSEGVYFGDPLDELVFASTLLGADRRVANFGGGNTSAKAIVTDHVGRERRVLWVKGSGSDLASIRPEDFTGLRLDQLELLVEREEMSDEEMTAYLGLCTLDPAMPRGSIETLLHAFVPAAHIHHTHPDAVNALAGCADGEELVRECFDGTAAWVPYIRPGFTLAKQVGEAVGADSTIRLVVLAKHGLVCWGSSAKEAYEGTIEAIQRAAEFTNRRAAGRPRFGGRIAGAGELSDEDRRRILLQVLPSVRGAASSAGQKVLSVDTSPRVVEFLSSAQASGLVEVGAACPDHLVHTKRLPLWIPFAPDREEPEALLERIPRLAAAYREEYAAYFEGHRDGATVAADPDARVVLIQHVGLISVGPSVAASRLSRDLYHRAIEVMAGAELMGGFVSLSEAESFAVEYWPLELYKLSLAPPPGELQGAVALVTGAGGGIGRAVVAKLAAAGACVVGFDLDGAGANDAVAPLGERGMAVAGDVTSERAVAAAFEAAVERFGGVDIVVSNAGIASSAPIEETTLAAWDRNQAILGTGYFLVAREAFRLLRKQGCGGSIVFVASKNALVAGRNASAYSSAKAAEVHLARCLAEEGGAAGIRVNTVNPDAVLQGSRIWDSSWRQERAAAYGIEADQLERHYRERTVLRVNVAPEDVAEAVAHFASPARSGKSTGNILNVDGGNAAAYPR